MEEIKRCQEISLDIAFIALLGDKYGWCPLPPSVDADEFESILERISDKSDKDLINTWYHRDGNAVPPCYLLQPISSQFPIHSTDRKEMSEAWKDWEKVEKSLWNALRATADQIGLEDKDKQKYSVSVTQLEVEKAWLLILKQTSDQLSLIVGLII